MTRTQLVSAVPPGHNPPPANQAARPLTPLNTSEVHPSIGRSIDQVRIEIDDAFADIKTFTNREPDEIMRMAAGHSARLSELRVKAMRIEDFRPEWKRIRQRELEPALEELQRQWAHGSRLHSVRELDWRIESGER